jgi:hypothetical protein
MNTTKHTYEYIEAEGHAGLLVVVVYLTTLSFTLSNTQMSVTNEMERIWKKTVVA